MLTNADIGWTVLFNDHNGTKCPATVTKVYSQGNPNSNLDLHVIGIKNNASYSRGKLNVPYGINTLGHWEYSNVRTIQIDSNDLPTNGQGLIYNASNDSFETENINTLTTDADGGTF
jgi:uncharacterized protein YfaP (DUF2135 family)